MKMIPETLVEHELLYPSRAPEFTPVFSGIRVIRSLVLCNAVYIVVCPFVFFLLSIVLSVLLRFTYSDYTFGIFKLFLNTYIYISKLYFLYLA